MGLNPDIGAPTFSIGRGARGEGSTQSTQARSSRPDFINTALTPISTGVQIYCVICVLGEIYAHTRLVPFPP